MIAVDPAGDSTAAERVAGAVAEDPGIATASVVRSTPELAVVTAEASTTPQDERTQSTLQRLRSEALPSALDQSPATAHVGGYNATMTDMSSRVQDRLPLFLVAVVLLAKGASPFIQAAVAGLGAPPALVGVIVAAIVLLPEGLTALRAARDDQLQTSINLALGSGVASIGLTVPIVAAIAWWTNSPLALGVTPGGAILLALSFMMALITYGTGRATLLSGVVHLIMLATWLFLIVVP